VSGMEIILGVREDPQFGPFMLVGLGGVMVEVMRDLAIRLLPIDEPTAARDVGLLAERFVARRIPRPFRRACRCRRSSDDGTVAAVSRSSGVSCPISRINPLNRSRQR